MRSSEVDELRARERRRQSFARLVVDAPPAVLADRCMLAKQVVHDASP
jgi:hypothetical protein